MLVAQTQNGVTTRYVQDLAAPLSQILSDGSQRYVYGLPAERLYGQPGTSAKTWYTVDALGSVRATLNDAGIPQAVAHYDAWGVPETPRIAPFGFTGELQQGSDVWLRARWYGAGRGGFGSRDPYAGNAETPYSLMPYQYASSNPVLRTDPSGRVDCAPGDMICVQGGYGGLGGGGTGGDLFFHVKKALEACVAALGYALGVQTAPQQQDYLLPDEYVVPKPKKELPGPPVQPSQDPKSIVRVRHYSPAISQIKTDMRIKPSTQNFFALWVEYPITTPYEEKAIQKTTESFFRPLSGRGGFVEFNVDLRKWPRCQDPRFPDLRKAKIINWYSDVIGTTYKVVVFALTEPYIHRMFFH